MASLALRAFSSIASRAPQIFRTVWSAIKSSPTLSAMKDAVLGEIVRKGVDMIDERTKEKPEMIRNVWDIARTKVNEVAQSELKGYNSLVQRKKNLAFRIKKI